MTRLSVGTLLHSDVPATENGQRKQSTDKAVKNAVTMLRARRIPARHEVKAQSQMTFH